MTFTTPSKHDPDGIDIDNNFEDTMTTEEKKKEEYIRCMTCGAVEKAEVLPFPHNMGCSLATPPQTGREWEAEFEDLIEKYCMSDDAGCVIPLEDVKSFIRSIEATARAEGEKIGAEKERERIRVKDGKKIDCPQEVCCGNCYKNAVNHRIDALKGE